MWVFDDMFKNTTELQYEKCLLWTTSNNSLQRRYSRVSPKSNILFWKEPYSFHISYLLGNKFHCYINHFKISVLLLTWIIININITIDMNSSRMKIIKSQINC